MKRHFALPALAAAAILGGTLTATSSAHHVSGPPQIQIAASATGYSFDKKKLTAPAGTEFLLVFTNHSTQKHNVSIEFGELEYGATLTIGKSSTATVFTLKKGVYHFYSSVGKDEDKGMSGTLTVK